MTSTILYLLCVVIGGVSGLRSLTGIAIGRCGATRLAAPGVAAIGMVASGWDRAELPGQALGDVSVCGVAIGELIADKLPFTPPRIQAGPLVVRFCLGGLCGSALAVSAGMPWFFPAAVGGISAIVAAYAGYWLRKHHQPGGEGPAHRAARGCDGYPFGALRGVTLLGVRLPVVVPLGGPPS